MFTPAELDLERGWPGRIEGDRVVQLAAQTLQAFFTGGGTAREHAEYRLQDVQLRAPVLHPPSVRIFDSPERFEFANPAAIVGPDAAVSAPADLEVHAHVAAVVGADQRPAGLTILAEFRAPSLQPPKDRDFALALGPVVVTPDEAPQSAFDWEAALAFCASNTRLRPGDLIAAPAHAVFDVLETAEVEVEGIGVLRNRTGSG